MAALNSCGFSLYQVPIGSMFSFDLFFVFFFLNSPCFCFHSLRKKGSNLSFKKQTRGERPEDIGFPEYSKKFLKR